MVHQFCVALLTAEIITLGINYRLHKKNLEYEVKAKAASISQSFRITSNALSM
jgi:hypothetical protein